MCPPPDLGPVCVVGAGVAGLCVAVTLAERGHPVTVYEQATTLGAETCSWLAGGMLAPYCEAESAEPLVCERGLRALRWWAERIDGVVRNGSLVVSTQRDLPDLRLFEARTSHAERLDEAGLARLEPALAGRFQHGLWYGAEAHLDPRRALPALADIVRRHGGQIVLGQAMDAARAPCRVAIDCRGLAAQDRLPNLRGVRGEMLMLKSRDVRLARPVRLLHPRHRMYVVPRADGLFMVGATALESEDRGAPTARALGELLQAASTLHPGFLEAEVVEFRAGVRPAFSDNLPAIGRLGRTYYLNGLYRHGFLLAPWYAETLVERIEQDSREAA